MKLHFFLSVLIMVQMDAISAFAQHKPAYVLYNSQGKKTTYARLMKKVVTADVVLFGEFHNNPISHWLQLEVTQDAGKTRPLVLGAEMFERDNQEVLDQYLQGKIDQKGLDTLARLWKNYMTDYAPLVEYAKKNKLVFAGTNIPRRFASMVARGGFEVLEQLSKEEKSWMAPLPILYDSELPGYKKMLEMMAGHGGPNLPKAQAIKDATMAHFILKYYQPGRLFIHYNGAYHSDHYEGILWYLKKQKPALNFLTITTVSQADVHRLLPEHLHQADYIICVPETMTTTY